MKKLTAILLIILSIAIICAPAIAYSGRTDSKGGHWDHSTGTYHYHN